MGDESFLLGKPKKLTIWNKTFLCVFLAQAFMSLSQGSVNILIARYARESLQVSDVIMGNLVGLYYGVALAMRPVAGPMQTKLNKRNLLIAVYFTGGIVNLGYALFNTTGAFVTFRVLQGIQYSFMGSLTMILAVNSLPKEKVASGVAMYGLGGTVMQTIAPNIGIWLRDLGPKLKDGAEGLTLGYQFAFCFAACILALAVVPLFMIPNQKETRDESAETGVWYKNIISPHAIPITLVVILMGMSTSGFRNYIDAYANEVGIPSIGLFATTTAAMMICTRPLCGKLMDRYDMRKILPIGMILVAVALVIISRSKTLPVILIGGAFSSFGQGFVTPGLNAMCIQTETTRRRAVASNTLYGGMDLGYFIGPVWGGIVVSRYNFSAAIFSGLIPLALAMLCFFLFMPGFSRRRSTIEALQEE